MAKRPGTFGPLVIGEATFEQEAAVVATGRVRYGPLVTDDPDSPTPELSPPAPAASSVTLPPDYNGDGYSTIAELKRALGEARTAGDLDPVIVQALQLELARTQETTDGGPRKGALTELFTAEMQRADGPRPEVHAAIEAALKAISNPSK